MELFDRIAQLTALYGPSGSEGEVAIAISKAAEKYADEITTDVMGNLIVHKKGTGPKFMLSAHMDTVGLVVTYLEEDGTLRVGKLGGISPKEVRNALVRFENGTYGTVKVHGGADEDKLSVDDLYVDIGAANREEAKKLVRVGDMAVFAGQALRAGDRVISPNLDDRVACAVLLAVLERLEAPKFDLYFAFTVQEELGLRGAKTAAYGIDPQFALAVDVTPAGDKPGAPKTGSTSLGGGAGIKVMDASVISHPEMVTILTDLGKEKGIKTQPDVLTKGGTDAGAICQSRLGVVTGGVSIPCRDPHTPTAIVDLKDVSACVDIILAIIEN